jgi:GNAT superfamily N-acetyltransferase
MDRYRIRTFEPERDLEGAYRCFVQSFHHTLWPIIDHAERRFVEDLILILYEMGNTTYVAEAAGEARGILVGGFPFRGGGFLREMGLTLRFLGRVHRGRYRMRPLARATFRRVITGYLPFLYKHPLSPSTETLLLASQNSYRGGIGRAMMDAWVNESRTGGWKRTTVCTDSTLSWQFYERYGFLRVRSFDLHAYHYSLPAENATGYIYSLDIA